jgi:hypothetical protein
VWSGEGLRRGCPVQQADDHQQRHPGRAGGPAPVPHRGQQAVRQDQHGHASDQTTDTLWWNPQVVMAIFPRACPWPK